MTVTYSGTVKTRADLTAGGVTTIDNTVVPGDDVPNCTTTPGCDTTNPVAPHLTLVKNVVNGSTGTASSPDWTLTATGGGATPINGPGITNTTGPNADVASGDHLRPDRGTDGLLEHRHRRLHHHGRLVVCQRQRGVDDDDHGGFGDPGRRRRRDVHDHEHLPAGRHRDQDGRQHG